MCCVCGWSVGGVWFSDVFVEYMTFSRAHFVTTVGNAFQDVDYTLISMKSGLGWVGPCLKPHIFLFAGLGPAICDLLCTWEYDSDLSILNRS